METLLNINFKFNFMKNYLLRSSSRKMLFSAMMASALLAGTSIPVWADRTEVEVIMQSVKVQGQVLDVNGEPVIGASVQEKGTTNGVITDIDGNFTMNVASRTAKVVITFIGYQKAEFSASDPRLAKVVLKEDAQALEEVVVVGYGTQKKETLTGAVTVVGAEKLENKGSLASPLQALQGQVPGVMITRGSGAPGEEGWTMKLRGAFSKNNSEPLIIIDGVEYSDGIGGLRNINSDDIESMNFLKDASAAIYGSKAAGGVVLITTKKAKQGRTQVQYNGSFTGKVIGLQPELMSLDQWADAVIDAYHNDGTTDEPFLRYAEMAKMYKNKYVDLNHSVNAPGLTGIYDYVFMDNDWQDILWGNSWSTQHELSVSGGGEKALYRLSLGYMYNSSALNFGNNSDARYNFRLTNTFNLTKNLSVESVIAYNREQQVKPSLIGQILTTSFQQPGTPFASKNGQPYIWGNWAGPNWLADLAGDDKLKVYSFQISETINYKIYSDLDAVVQLGYNSGWAVRDTQENAIDWSNYAGDMIAYQKPLPSDSKYTKAYANTDYYMISGYLNWHHTFAEVHNLSVMIGSQYNQTQYERTESWMKDIKPSLQIPNGSGDKGIGASKWHEAMMSYFGRLNYDWKQRYLLEGNFRYDGSSKFQPENRWQFFWGASAGWRVTEEKFMKPLLPIMSNLKLRFSYGVVGNQGGIDRYDGTQFYNFTSSGGVLMNGEKISYINTNGQIASTGRTWEKIHNYNLGLDFGFLNNRLTGMVELFLKKNNNMLVNAQYAGVLGDSAPAANMGKFEGKGWEGELNWRDKIGPITYHLGGTVTYATNKLIDLGTTSVMGSGFKSLMQGYPLNSYFGLRYVGKIQNEEQLEKYTKRYLNGNTIGLTSNIRLGDNMFEDVNKDGKLTDEDYIYLGTDDPKLSYSFNAGLEWNGFDVSVVFQGVGQRTIFRDGGWRIPLNAVWLNSTTQGIGNTWTPENRDAYYPSLTIKHGDVKNYNYQCSSWSVEDGSYLRLKNLTIGYTLPKAWLAKTNFISKLRLYFVGADLWEHSKIHDGWDPEQSRTVSGLGRYPFNRTFTVGISATF